MEASKAWQKKKAEAGYAAITWPKEWGGQGGQSWQNVIFGQEEAKAAPGLSGPFAIGLGMCIPTILTAGNDEDKKRFAQPAVRGEEIWCQLFSEPSGGSDAAAARTRAVKEGDEWVINGQKVWTSGAHYSDYGLLLARTDPDVPKHKGLTMFWIDMHASGRGGAADPPDERRLQLQRGLFHRPAHQGLPARGRGRRRLEGRRHHPDERAPVSVGGGASGSNYGAVMKLAEGIQTMAGPSSKDAGLREKIADWFVQAEGLKYTTFRTMTALSRGQTPGPENSIAKIVAANVMQEMANEAMDLEDQFGILKGSDAPLAGAFQQTL